MLIREQSTMNVCIGERLRDCVSLPCSLEILSLYPLPFMHALMHMQSPCLSPYLTSPRLRYAPVCCHLLRVATIYRGRWPIISPPSSLNDTCSFFIHLHSSTSIGTHSMPTPTTAHSLKCSENVGSSVCECTWLLKRFSEDGSGCTNTLR